MIEARNGQEALSFLINRPDEHVSLILLDLQMPVMDGWALLEVLRCYVAWSKIPVIIVSAQEAHLERTLHRGVRGCIRAPYEVNDLIHRVDECMSGSRSTTLEHHDPGERTG